MWRNNTGVSSSLHIIKLMYVVGNKVNTTWPAMFTVIVQKYWVK